MFTSYGPAIRVRATRSANPWPSDADLMETAHAWYRYYSRPARPFPATTFCQSSARPQKREPLRIDTAELPVLTLAQWQAEQQRLAEQPQAPARRPPPRKKSGFERWLDQLIAWRTGANKVRPDWHVYQKTTQAPAHCGRCQRPYFLEEAYYDADGHLICPDCYRGSFLTA